MTTNNRKVLIIGIDGGTWTVLKPAIEMGYMPFLKSLADSGVSGALESTIPAITPAAWGAFQTGKNPGKTGVFDFAYMDVKQQKSQYVNSLDLGPTLWDILSQHGKKIAVINVPMTYPPKPVNGYLISGLVTPSLESDFTWPRELKSELLKTVPGYQIFDLKQIASYRSDEERLEGFLAQLLSIVENRTQAALWILEKSHLDVFMVHFQATDVLQHVYWHYLDDTHPLFDSSKRLFLFEKFYQILDQKIELIHKKFSEHNGCSLAVVVSDHGFQSHYKRFNLGNWLETNGYLKIRKNAVYNSKVTLLKRITRTLRIGKILKYLVSLKTIETIDKKYISKSEIIDWENSTACSMGRSGEGFIYFLTENEHERRLLTDELRQNLLDICDPQAGKRIVRHVWLKQDLFKGPQLERIPDFVIEPNDGYSFTGYFQIGEGLFHNITLQSDMHIGKHHQDGILVAAGNGICVNKKLNTKIINLAPTLLWYMGISPTSEMDGTVIMELFEENLKQRNIVNQHNKADTIYKNASCDYSLKDEKDIEQRLKDLGYL